MVVPLLERFRLVAETEDEASWRLGGVKVPLVAMVMRDLRLLMLSSDVQRASGDVRP